MKIATPVFFLYLLSFLFLITQSASAEKPSPISSPLPTTTPVTITKGYIDYWDWSKPVTVIGNNKSIVIEKGSEGVFYTDPEFAATYNSVMFQEHGFLSGEREPVLINGIYYRVVGCMQILIDGMTLPIVQRFNWTIEEIRDDCSKNIRIAYEVYKLFDNTWRQWVAKPQYRTDETHPVVIR